MKMGEGISNEFASGGKNVQDKRGKRQLPFSLGEKVAEGRMRGHRSKSPLTLALSLGERGFL